MTKHLLAITALILFLVVRAPAQDQVKPREALFTKTAVPAQDFVNPEAFPFDINGKVKLDAGAEDAVLLSLSGQVNLTPALMFQSNTRELVFTNTDPSSCSSLRLYVNRTNKTIWANVDGVCAQVGGTGGGGGGGGGNALTSNPLSQFAPTTSAQFAGVITNETGTGLVVMNDSPNIISPTGIVKADVGLANVDNTSDVNKPVSSATQTALNLKANLASPTFTGTVTLPTPFTLGATSVTATGAEMNFLAGTTSAIQTQLDARVPTARTVSTTAPLFGGGALSGNLTITIQDAVADGSTKGAATYTAADFNSAGGVISIDYANGQTATGSVKGFLSNADWTTFNGKVGPGAITSSGLTMATARILGRSSASTGSVEEITIGTGLQLSGGVLSNTASGGTVTVVGGGSLTSSALVTGGGSQTIQTPAATATMDSSGNISTPGSLTSGAGSSAAGAIDLGEGTAQSLVANTFTVMAPTDVAAGGLAYVLPSAASTGFLLATDASGVMTITHVGSSGSGNVARVSSPTFTTPTLGVAAATSINGLTITTSTGTLTVTNGKTASFSNTLTFTGTDASSIAFGTGGTVAYTIANGTSALGTSAIASGACASAVTTTATGTATTDVVLWDFNADPTGVTGYQPSANGMLTIIAYPTSNNVNFKVCNNTASSITPGAVTLNWRITR